MKKINSIRDIDIFLKPKFLDLLEYNKRVTVKAIVQNSKGEFAFVTNSIHKFVLLPGGGTETKKLKKEINRECEEEISYSIKNIKKLFTIKEFRNRNAKEYETVCFYGRIDKKISKDFRTEEEKKNGLKVLWLNKEKALNILHKQVKKLKKGEVKFYNIAFNILRDYKFFKEYIKEKEEKLNKDFI